MNNDNNLFIEKSESELDKYGVWIKSNSVSKTSEDELSRVILSKKEIIEKAKNYESNFNELKKEIEDLKNQISSLKNNNSYYFNKNENDNEIIENIEDEKNIFDASDIDSINFDLDNTDSSLFNFDSTEGDLDIENNEDVEDSCEQIHDDKATVVDDIVTDEKLSTADIDNLGDIEVESDRLTIDELDNSDLIIHDTEEENTEKENCDDLSDVISNDFNLDELNNIESPVIEDIFSDISDSTDSKTEEVNNTEIEIEKPENNEEVYATDTTDKSNLEKDLTDKLENFDFDLEVKQELDDDIIIEKPEIIEDDDDTSIALTNDELLSMMDTVDVKPATDNEPETFIEEETSAATAEEKVEVEEKVKPTKQEDEVAEKKHKTKKSSKKAIDAISNEKLKDVMLYLDNLLENLPDDKIKEFANSKYFDEYNEIFEDLGIK